MIPSRALIGADADVLRETRFQMILVANLIALLGNPFLSPVLDSLIDPFGVTATEIGWMISAYTAPGIILMPVAGRLADRFGRKPVLLTGLIVFGVAGTTIAFTTDYRVVLGLRLVQGAGGAALVPILVTVIGDVYDGSREATAQGLRLTSSGVTNMVFPLLAGVLVVVAWQLPFLLYALSFVVAAMIFLWFREPTGHSSGGSGTIGASDYHGEAVGVGPQSIRALLSYRRVQLLVVIRVLPTVVWIAFLTYNSIIVVQFMSGTPTQAGALVVAGSLAHAIAAAQAGRITARFESRLSPLLVANVALGGGFGVMLLASDLWLAMLGMFVSGIGFGVTLSLYRSIITGYAPVALRGSLVSISEGMSKLAMTLTPLQMGATIAWLTPQLGFRPAVQVAGFGVALVATVGGILGLLLVRTTPRLPRAK